MKLKSKVTGITLSALTLLPLAFTLQSVKVAHAKTAPSRVQPAAPAIPTIPPVVGTPINPEFNSGTYVLHESIDRLFRGIDPRLLTVGKLRIEEGSGEFYQQLTSINFHETPTVKFIWTENERPLQAAEWRLFTKGKFLGSKKDVNIPLASGTINNIVTAPAGRSYFSVDLKDHLTKDHLEHHKDFWIQIYGQNEGQEHFSMVTNAVGARWLGDRKPPEPINPYACSAAAGTHSRNVELSIPTMRVNSTSTTNGDGGRDEFYLNVAQNGPNSILDRRKFPPQLGNYYAAKPGRTYNENLWIDKREDDDYKVAHPVLWRGHLSHGEKVEFMVRLQEQDNGDISDIINTSTSIVDALGQAGSSIGGQEGAIIGAVSQSINLLLDKVPLNSKHDAVGDLAINLENRCGYIKTFWSTTAKNSGGRSASFQDTVSHLNAVIRMKALDDGTRQTLFGDFDFQEYDYVDTQDEFFYHANGTSNSSYSFLLRAKVLP